MTETGRERRPVFVNGIGPPVQQIAEDHRELPLGRASEDILALVAAVLDAWERESVLRADLAAEEQATADLKVSQAALLAVVEAAQEVVEDSRWVTDEGPRERLEQALLRLHSQASDEGKPE